MNKVLLTTIIAGIVIGLGITLVTSPVLNLGGDNTKFVASNVLFLSSGITSSQTTITLTKFQIPNTTTGVTMTDFGDVGYMTLEPGRTKREFISFTGITQNAGGTATLTGVSRGLSPVAPYTASTTQQQSHSGGIQIIVSNPPQLYNRAAFKDNDESVTGQWDFASTSIPAMDAYLAPTDDEDFAAKKYVDDTAASGAADGTETVKGLVELAVGAEAAATTLSGGAARLVLPTAISTSTGAVSGGPWVPITSSAGKLAQLFLDLTEAFAFSGNNTFAGTSIFNGTVTANSTTALATTTVSGTLGVTELLTAADTTFTGTATTTNLVISTSCIGCLSGYERILATTTLSTSQDAGTTGTADCTAGKKILGGGYLVSGAYVNTASYPSDEDTWTATVTCEASALGTCTAGDLTTYALCVTQ